MQGKVLAALPAAGVYYLPGGQIDNGYEDHGETGMRIFVVEYITGGGLPAGKPDSGFLQEAEVMQEALLGDLMEIAGIELLVSRDPRLTALKGDFSVFEPRPDRDIWTQWGDCIAQCDAVWPIMPEGGGLLARISTMTVTLGRRLIGCSPTAVAVAASKYRTFGLLERAGIDVVPTWRADGRIPCLPGAWVLKPDDGAGCEGIRVFDSHAAMGCALPDLERPADCIAQPFVEGEAASLSLICCDRHAHLLSVNLQQVVREGAGLRLDGLFVNARPRAGSGCADLAQAVAEAMPGLWGYVGVDILLTGRGPVVLEINPRLTVSYAGLYSALGVNPAEIVVRLLGGGGLPARGYAGSNSVNIALEVPCVA